MAGTAHEIERPAPARPGGERRPRRAARPPRGGGVAAWGLAFLVLAAAVYGRHVLDGGFYWDDWQLAARNLYPVQSSPDYHGVLDLTLLGYRPLLALLLPAIHAVLGPHPSAHIALGLILAAATATCFWASLRAAGLEPFHAAGMAALSLLFPWADSMRLWPTAAVNTVAVCLYLAGVALALHGLRAGGRRGRRLTAAALILYALSVLTYEVAAVAMLLGVIAYARVVGWPRAWRRWALDVVAIVGPLLYVALNTPRSKESLSGQIDHARVIADQALTLAARSVVPVDGVGRGVGLALLAALAGGAGLALRGLAPGDPAREGVRRWLLVAAAAVLGVGASLVLFVPADAHYQPLAPGVNNRINLLAAPAYAALAYAAAMLAGTLLAAAARRRARGVAVGAVAALAIAAGWTARVERDIDTWDRSAALQRRVLDAVAHALPDPPRGTTIYTSGERTYAAPGVPVFSVSWDLKGAVRVRLRRRDLRGYALRAASELRCGRARLYPRTSAYGPAEGAPYGRAFAVDVPTARATAIDSPAACRALAARLGRP
jgi:hypothetical protein